MAGDGRPGAEGSCAPAGRWDDRCVVDVRKERVRCRMEADMGGRTMEGKSASGLAAIGRPPAVWS